VRSAAQRGLAAPWGVRYSLAVNAARRRALRLDRFLRALVAFVLALAMASSSALAWALPCSARAPIPTSTEDDGDRCCPGEGDAAADDLVADEQPLEELGDCDCPVDCGACCARMPASTLELPAVVPLLLPAYTLISFAPVPSEPATGTLGDILHVPRR
jgi:hypothetical protein